MHLPKRYEPERMIAGLVLLGAIHVLYWWRPWRMGPSRAVAAVSGMVATNFVLLNLLGLAEPLVWLYPALIAGAGFRVPMAVVGVGLTALAAAAPMALEGSLVHPPGLLPPAVALGPSHSVLLSIVLAGLGMTAVRQLIAVLKDAPVEVLAAAIRRYAAGEDVVDPSLAARALRAGPGPLSTKEREILAACAEGLSTAELVTRVWLSQGTVRNRVSEILGKLGARNRAEAVQIAQDNGWL